MKVLISIVMVFIFCLMGCSTVPPHRAAYYQQSTGEKWARTGEALASRGGTTVSDYYKCKEVYPECANQTSQGDFFNCVTEIDIKEGRMKDPGPRPNLDDAMKGKR